MLTVMRTAAGTPICVSQILKFKEAGVRVVAVDCDPMSVGFAFADAAACVPPAASRDFIECMLDVARRKRVDWVIPALDEELVPLAAAREQFRSAGVELLLSGLETVRICTDKLATYRYFRDHQIPTPETHPLSEATNLRNLPIIIKPRYGRGSRDVRLVSDFADIRLGSTNDPDMVAQEYIQGAEYTTDIVATCCHDAALLCTRRRIATDSGICSKAMVEHHDEIEKWVRQLTRQLKLFGPANIQCFVTPENKVVFTEINARIAGSFMLSVAAGAPMIEGLVALMRGETVPQQPLLSHDLVMLRYWTEVYVTRDKMQGWTLSCSPPSDLTTTLLFTTRQTL
jgi:carbamoyl-phosphate synthase large subunit